MARAKRHYLSGNIWHITHRCHQKEFLLKFARDRRRWLQWLFEAKKRYGLCILNYMVTSNHIHLLVFDDKDRQAIPKSLQLIAGRTAQEYNRRKNRKGAFWEDRYHATAVSSGRHLAQCIAYIDLNMVRSGAVGHPSEWECSGYNELQGPRKRYALIDYQRLMDFLQISTIDNLVQSHRRWIDEVLKQKKRDREARWTQCIAVGDHDFVEDIRAKLGIRKTDGRIEAADGSYRLRESHTPYPDSTSSEKNTFPWELEKLGSGQANPLLFLK